MTDLKGSFVTNIDGLATHYEKPTERLIKKRLDHVNAVGRAFIAASPFLVLERALLIARRSGGPPRERNGQYRHGGCTKAAIAEERKFSALHKMPRAALAEYLKSGACDNRAAKPISPGVRILAGSK